MSPRADPTSPQRAWKAPATRRRATAFSAILLTGALAAGQERSASMFYREGEALYDRGDLAGALRAFERSYLLDPRSQRGDRVGMHFEDYDPAFQLGRIHARLGEFERARRYFNECAASGYTVQSSNAEEFARWKAIVDRELSSAPPRAPVSATPTVSPTPLPTETPEPKGIVADVRATAAPSPATTPAVRDRMRPTEPIPSTDLPASVSSTPPAAPETPALPAAAVEIERRAAPARFAPPSPSRTALLVPILLLLGTAAAFALWRRRDGARTSDAPVHVGRYSITGLLAAGTASFVYAARDRKSGEAVALRVLRPDAGGPGAERFRREIAALERLRGRGGEPPGPRLIESATRTTGAGTLEYAAVERLAGRTLLDLSRNARRRPDAAVLLEILQALAAALAEAAAAGLSHPDLSSGDVFLLDPVPLTAGSPIRLRLLGLVEEESDADRNAVRGISSIALELFRDEGAAEDPGVASSRRAQLPPPLSDVVRRVEEGARVTLAELAAAIETCRRNGPAAASQT